MVKKTRGWKVPSFMTIRVSSFFENSVKSPIKYRFRIHTQEYSTSDYCICAAWIESLNDDGHDYDYRCSVMKTRREMDTKIPAMTKTDTTVSTAGRYVYLTKYYIHSSQNP